MSKMVQLRNVPDSLHCTLKVRAAMASMTLSDYLINEIRRSAERPTLDEIRQRLQKRKPVRPRISPAEAVRAEREAH